MPILQAQSETDVPRYLGARQPDTTRLRTWEITGTSHVDANVLASVLGCSTQVNSGPEIYVMDAALASLNSWIENPADAPAKAARIETDSNGTIARDADGNARGGLRTPQLNVPVATLSGEGGSGPGFCAIAGVTKPFSLAKVTSLYGSKDAYLEQFGAAMNGTIAKGFLLKADGPAMTKAAAASWPTN